MRISAEKFRHPTEVISELGIAGWDVRKYAHFSTAQPQLAQAGIRHAHSRGAEKSLESSRDHAL
jgi:hypothetical protein